MGNFDGYLLVSDFDGTLIDNHFRISEENVAAINLFVEKGGRFLGATGRTELNVRPYTEKMELSSPWILYNGAAIFDWSKQAFIYKSPLDRSLTEPFVRKIIALLPSINVQVFFGGPHCQVNNDAIPDYELLRETEKYLDVKFENKPMEAIADDWLKVLFCSDTPDDISAIAALLEIDPLRPHVHTTHSSPRYFELLATGVNKGTALSKLKTLMNPHPHCVVAIGDYLNDLEMLQEADISAAPESAIHEVKSIVQIITSDHDQSAVADLVRRLEVMRRAGELMYNPKLNSY